MKPTCSTIVVLASVVLLSAFEPVNAAGVSAATVLYAKPTATGAGDCSSWANACTLQTALNGPASGAEIWVAAGTHKPTASTDRSATFQLIAGVALYGDFAGTETTRSQRNPATNMTILSGDAHLWSDADRPAGHGQRSGLRHGDQNHHRDTARQRHPDPMDDHAHTPVYTVTLKLCWLAGELNGQSPADLTFWRYSGTTWFKPTSIEPTASGCATLAGVTELGQWTLGVPYRVYVPLLGQN